MPSHDAPQASSRSDAVAIIRRLREHNHVAYLAGGCVRDELLGLTPKDYDVATDAPPHKVRQLFSNTQAVGAAFGVILVRHGSSTIEVATFRTDGKYEDGRRPSEVTFTTAEHDAQRRDFTINGLFLDPIENKIIDYVGGQQDLKDKILRAIGEPNHRFEEDHLRLLRAVRFASRFDLDIDAVTSEAILRHSPFLSRISPERIAEELRLILPARSRVQAWTLLWNYGLLQVIFRTLPEKPDAPVPSERGSRPMFPQLLIDGVPSFPCALAALVYCYRSASWYGRTTLTLLERGEVMRTVQSLRTTLRISNDEQDEIETVLSVGFLLNDNPPTTAQLKRFLSNPYSASARHFLDSLARSAYELSPRIGWLKLRFDEFEKGDYAPAPFITGDDLTAAGLSPGPKFKRILDTVYDAQLEDRIKTTDEALALATQLASEGK